MLFGQRNRLLIAALVLLSGALLTGAIAAAGPQPRSTVRASFRAVGEPLEGVLRRASSTYESSLSASGELRSQRVTLLLRDASLELLSEGLEELLSPSKTERVFWVKRKSGGWLLEQNLQRRELIAQLQNQDLEQFRKHLESERAWMQEQGEQDLEAARKDTSEWGSARVLAYLERYVFASLVDALGEERRAALLTGTPQVVPLGALKEPLRGRLRDFVRRSSSSVTDETLERGHWVLVLSRRPTDPLGADVRVSIVRPNGSVGIRFSALKIPHPFADPVTAPLQWPPPEAEDRSRRITFRLDPPEGVQPRTLVQRSMAELLETVGKAADLNIVADGYLRTSAWTPAAFELRDYPLHQLLDRLAVWWDCSWRYLDAEKKTVIIRANGWWMEDRADLPDALVQELKAALPATRTPDLKALSRLAQLSVPQIDKLIQCDLCPGATGMIHDRWHDEIDARACLRFFGRLPEPLQKRALSEEGLPLSAVPPGMVEEGLGKILLAWGAVLPEFREGLVFSIRPGSVLQHPNGVNGWQIRINSPRLDPNRPLFQDYVFPYSRRAPQ